MLKLTVDSDCHSEKFSVAGNNLGPVKWPPSSWFIQNCSMRLVLIHEATSSSVIVQLSEKSIRVSHRK